MEKLKNFFSKKSNLIERLGLLIVLTLFFIIQIPHFNIDFWNDEIYTLKNFVFVPISTTLTDYHVPNNHIFFNLLNNIYLKIWNIDSLHQLMDNPYIIRFLPFCYSVITLLYVYRFGKKFFGQSVGFFSVSIMLCSIGFYNYALQIRGYSLSMLLLIMIAFYTMSFFKKENKKHLIYIGVLSTFSFYTVPVNIYPLLGICGFLFFRGLWFRYKILKTKSLQSIKVLSSIIIGTAICFCFYLPMFQDVFFNEYVVSKSFFNIRVINSLRNDFWEAIIAKQYHLSYLFWGGVILSFFNRKSYFWKNENVLLWMIFLSPFLISYVRGDEIPQRALSMIIPFFSIGFAVSIYSLFQFFPKIKQYIPVIILPLVIYSFFVFEKQREHIENWLFNGIHGGHRSQNMTYNYYLGHYRPLEDVRYFYNNHFTKTSTVVVHSCEPHGFFNYLEKYKIPYLKSEALEKVLNEKIENVFVVVRFPNELKSFVSEKFPNYEVKQLRSDVSYNNIFELKIKSTN